MYVDMSLLNQGVQEGKRQSVWKGYWLCRAELHREELPHLPVSLPPGSREVIFRSHKGREHRGGGCRTIETIKQGKLQSNR